MARNCLEIIDVLISMKETNLTNSMLVLRILCNLFTAFDNKIEEIIKYLIDNRVTILNKFTKCFSNESLNKNFQISFSTFVLNHAVLLNKITTDKKLPNDSLEAMRVELLHYICGEMLSSSLFNWDSEAVFRLLVCIGTLITDNPYLKTIAKSIVDLKSFCIKLEMQQEKNLPKVNSCLSYLKSALW